MPVSKWPLIGVAVGSFLLGVLMCIFGPYFSHAIFTAIEGRSEEGRTTSPDGQFDAVIVSEAWGGGAGGFEWYVYILEKGKVPSRSYSSYPNYVFRADELRGEKLVWAQPHLLEIRYDKADIDFFRNLWGEHEIRNVGSQGFLVEIRLAPFSPDFSLLTPSGAFR